MYIFRTFTKLTNVNEGGGNDDTGTELLQEQENGIQLCRHESVEYNWSVDTFPCQRRAKVGAGEGHTESACCQNDK